ncbi:hypothetical protein GCM10010278_66810 [Streptomyces melanogenes]|nr:hypothetical protein GCM10010278_66810 [Streptomyces melanogenes]
MSHCSSSRLTWSPDVVVRLCRHRGSECGGGSGGSRAAGVTRPGVNPPPRPFPKALRRAAGSSGAGRPQLVAQFPAPLEMPLRGTPPGGLFRDQNADRRVYVAWKCVRCLASWMSY